MILKKTGIQLYLRQIFMMTCLGLLCGCILTTEKYKPVSMFDLGTPPALNIKHIFIQIEPFMNESPCLGRMFYRLAKNKVEADDYNRWIQNPAAMLTTYLITAFKSRKTPGTGIEKPAFIVTGKIIQFEIDFNESDVVFTVDYQVRQAISNTLLVQDSKTYRKPYAAKRPDAFAVAMSSAVEAFASDLKLEIISLSKKKSH